MSLPRQSMAQPQFGLAKTTNASASGRVEITADLIDLQMPTTNQLYRSLAADRNVVITSAADQSRATANKALFEEGAGIVELTGDAVWQAADRSVRGQLLRYVRTNGFFFAKRDAYLKVPVSALSPSPTSPSAPGRQQKTTNSPPQFVEVYSTEYTYTSNSLVFRDNVRGQLLEGDTPRGGIQCALLGLRFTNQLESARASGGVKLEQFP